MSHEQAPPPAEQSTAYMSYIQLRDPGNEIRLFSFTTSRQLGARRTTSIKLATYRLEDCPPYIALSYAWGDLGEAPEPIFVDGRLLLVQPSCAYALEQLK